jgi:hypothetical protein
MKKRAELERQGAKNSPDFCRGSKNFVFIERFGKELFFYFFLFFYRFNRFYGGSFFLFSQNQVENDTENHSNCRAGNGDVLVFELVSESAENFLPAEGIYPIKDMEPIEDGMIIGGFDIAIGTPIGSYIQHMENDEFVSWDLITGGAMEIKKTKKENELEFYIYTVNADGVEGYYYYKGELLITNLSAQE